MKHLLKSKIDSIFQIHLKIWHATKNEWTDFMKRIQMKSTEKLKFWSTVVASVSIILVAVSVIGAVWTAMPLSDVFVRVGASFFVIFLLSLFIQNVAKGYCSDD